MTIATDSRQPEEVIFERYWAHACAQLYGLAAVEIRAPEGGYIRQPVDDTFVAQVELALHVSNTHRFRADIHAAVRCLFEAIGRMPTTVEILQCLPCLGKGISNFAKGQSGQTA